MLDTRHTRQAVAAAIGISTTSLYRRSRDLDEGVRFRLVVARPEHATPVRVISQALSLKGYVLTRLGLESVAVLLGRLG
ncbi:MAG: hypothetical protein EA397_00665 [Deltaproteobacteria bacterium]|nr:MAG: hypothetical protein EA397_00665 [Deltaproteobacteria bacterium]